MRLDNRQTSAFLAVAECGSFESAALHLHLTTSALSQRVKALEAELNTILFVRSRPCRLSTAGQRLLSHLKRLQTLENDLYLDLLGEQAGTSNLSLAINADSLDTWFLPAVAGFCQQQAITLDLCIDDQEHTQQLLAQGQVLACISTLAESLPGCEAQFLGVMRYQATCSKAFYQRWFAEGVNFTNLRLAPLVNYNRKDQLQRRFLSEHFGLQQAQLLCHHIPASTPFNQALSLGLGWGMIPELMLNQLPDLQLLVPDRPIDVPLYWHSWKIQGRSLNLLAQQVLRQAHDHLRP